MAACQTLGGLVGWTAWRERARTDRRRRRALARALAAYLPFDSRSAIEGRQYVPREALLKALEVGRGDMLLAVNLAGLRQRLEAIDWIEHAAVGGGCPASLHISLVERVAVAIWQRGENVHPDRSQRSFGPPRSHRRASSGCC